MNSNLVEKKTDKQRTKKVTAPAFHNDVSNFWNFSKIFSFVLESPTSNNLTHGLIFWGNKLNNLMHSTTSERMSLFNLVLMLYSYS